MTSATMVDCDATSRPAVQTFYSLQQHSTGFPRYDGCSNDNVTDITSPSLPFHINELFVKAYGALLINLDRWQLSLFIV